MSILPPVTLIRESSPIAAKPHRCLICDGPILYRERYLLFILRKEDSLDPRHALRVIRLHLQCDPMEATDA